jgi:hypothetical protein
MNFDHLIIEISQKLTHSYLSILSTYKEFRQDIDISPLLNLTMGVFLGSLVNVLDKILEMTEGEPQLFVNIKMAQNTLIKAVESLTFITKVDFFSNDDELKNKKGNKQ